MTIIDRPSSRHVDWPDAAKGIGIVLMYYGHVLASLPSIESGRGVGPGLAEMRFIYSFHMPLFFLMAGFFFRPAANVLPRMRELAVRRLIPVAFFGLLLLPLWSLGPLRHGESMWVEIGPMLQGYLRGMPKLNWVTWFLVCLFVCECIALLVLPRFRSMPAKLACGLVSIYLGVQACNHLDAVARLFGIESHTWFIYEAIVAFGLYAVGNALYPALQALSRQRVMAAAIGVLCLSLAALASPLNAASAGQVVMMAAERQGVPTLFAFTAICGSVGVIALAMLVQRWTVMRLLGRHSMALLGMSGLFYHFVNPHLMARWPPAETPLTLTLYAAVVTAVSVALVLPFALFVMRHAPVLVGKPATRKERVVVVGA
jgi:fucose 4-O-acetylase-like acetyltransferase